MSERQEKREIHRVVDLIVLFSRDSQAYLIFVSLSHWKCWECLWISLIYEEQKQRHPYLVVQLSLESMEMVLLFTKSDKSNICWPDLPSSNKNSINASQSNFTLENKQNQLFRGSRKTHRRKVALHQALHTLHALRWQEIGAWAPQLAAVSVWSWEEKDLSTNPHSTILHKHLSILFYFILFFCPLDRFSLYFAPFYCKWRGFLRCNC